MENTLTPTEKKIKAYLLSLKNEFELPGREFMTFDNVKDLAVQHRLDEKHIAAMNGVRVLQHDAGRLLSNWNPHNPHINVLVKDVVREYDDAKRREKKKDKMNEKTRQTIFAKYKPLFSTSTAKNPSEGKKINNRTSEPKEETITHYNDLFVAMYNAKEILRADLNLLIKKCKVSPEATTALNKFGVTITHKGVILWDTDVTPTKEFACEMIRYVNAKTQKKELPVFDIAKYKNNAATEIILSQATSLEVKPKEEITNIVSEKDTVEKTQIKAKATLHSGDTAEINMLLAQEIIAKGGDKTLALKLMRNEI